MPTKTRLRLGICKEDLADLAAIDSACFGLDKWTEEDFLHVLRVRNCIGVVAEVAGKIAGYMLYEFHPEHLEVLRFAVAPTFQRLGVGTAMIARLQAKCTWRRPRLVADVPDDLLSAHLLLKACGCRAVNIVYHGTDAAYRFEWVRPGCADEADIRAAEERCEGR